MDFAALLKARQAWDTFKENHPKFPPFLTALKNRGVVEGTEILISVTYPDGQNMRAGIKVKPSDLELLRMIESFSSNNT